MFNIRVILINGTASMPPSYMMPFESDAPPTWDFTYYGVNSSGHYEPAK